MVRALLISSAIADFGSDHEVKDKEDRVSLPWVVPTLSDGGEDLAFESRNCAGGIYAYLQDQFKEYEKNSACHPNFLAFAEYDKHFYAFPQSYGDHVSFRMLKDEDHRFTGFGEVMPAAEGTMLGAMGNHYAGSAIKVCVLFVLYLLLTKTSEECDYGRDQGSAGGGNSLRGSRWLVFNQGIRPTLH